MGLFSKKKNKTPPPPPPPKASPDFANRSRAELDRIAEEMADIRLKLPESSGYLDQFINEVRHFGEEINNFNDMVYTAEPFVKVTQQKGREASIRDVEYAWDGIAGFRA